MRLILKEIRPTLHLAIPIATGSASMVIMGVVDSLMIGRTGAVPLAASAFANSVFTFFLIANIGLVMPVAILTSRSHGERKVDECAEWLRHGLGIGMVSSIIGFLAMTLMGLRLDLFQQPPEVIREGLPYYLLIAASIVPATLFQVLRQYAEALGFPWMPMCLLFCAVALNTVLNWLLIYGHWGAPALGLTGAGIATFVSRLLCLLALLLWLRPLLTARGEWPRGKTLGLRWFRPLDRKKLKTHLDIGLPCAGQLLFEVGAFTATAVMMGWLGTKSLAAHQIALSCCSLTFMVPLGLSNAAGIRLSRALGSGDTATLRPIGLSSFVISWLAMGLFGLFFAVCGSFVAERFIQDSEVVSLAARLLLVAAIFQLFDGTQVVAAGALRGLSDVKIPTIVTGVAYLALAVPLSYLVGVRLDNPLGVWSGLATGLGVAAVALFSRFLRKTAQMP